MKIAQIFSLGHGDYGDCGYGHGGYGHDGGYYHGGGYYRGYDRGILGLRISVRL